MSGSSPEVDSHCPGVRFKVGEISCRNGALGEVALPFMKRVDRDPHLTRF
jgi:hypothetical protein